ncbi:hypothetical protein AY600_09185 [Phormidium willei BDU 130791]|nr:hypothetical protein AY600_09185 [Phormidium willei BDU 130791]
MIAQPDVPSSLTPQEYLDWEAQQDDRYEYINFSEVPQLASLKLGLPTTTQFKDGFIRLRGFPLHPQSP